MYFSRTLSINAVFAPSPSCKKNLRTDDYVYQI